MFIAFEGPDETGKSTSATALAANGVAIVNATKDKHQVMQKDHLEAPELPITYDRIDWLTHMVYRMALPEKEWNDPRVRTVFTMPDTHLVFKLHHPSMAGKIEAIGEGYAPGRLTSVNQMYYDIATWLMNVNARRGYTLFKSITILEIWNDQYSSFATRLVDFDSSAFDFETVAGQLVHDDSTLLEFFRYVDSHIG